MSYHVINFKLNTDMIIKQGNRRPIHLIIISILALNMPI